MYALEPNRELAESVRRNAELNGLRQRDVRPVAVGANTSRIGFRIDETSGGGWVASSAEAKQTVDCITLDQLADEEGLEKVDVLRSMPPEVSSTSSEALCASCPRIDCR